MKKLLAVLTLTITMTSVLADNLYQTNNPFPQTVPQTMNNIYESEPAIMKQEAKQAKKSWFRKGKNLKKHDEANDYVIPQSKVINEGVQDGSFYVFK